MASWSAAHGHRLRELDYTASLSGLMPGLSFELDAGEMRELTARFAAFPGAIRAAMLGATEKARGATRNEIVKGFKRLLTLQPAYIGKGIKSKKAKMAGDGAQAEIRMATSRIPLIRYGVKPENPPRLKGVLPRNRPHVAYSLRRGGEVYGDTPHDAPPDASRLFVARMKSGHIGVFYSFKEEKDGKSRRRIKEQYAPSLQYHAYADGFMEHIETFARQKLRAAFVEEAEKITGVGRL